MKGYYRRIAQSLKENDAATEINTGLAYRYPIKEMCPSPEFLKILSQYEVPITMSSDAHFPDDVGNLLDEARELLKSIGIKKIATFEKRKRIEIDLDK